MAWQNNDLRIRVIPEAQRIPCRSPALKLAVEIALTTALRESEVLGLRIEDLLGPDGGVRDKVKVKVKGGRWEVVNLPADLRASIMFHVKQVRRKDKGWLFPASRPRRLGEAEARMSRSTLVYLWHQAQREAGIGDLFCFHDLRHTAITRFYMRTKDVVLTMKFAHHRNIATTMLYVHFCDTDLAEAMEAGGNNGAGAMLAIA